MPPLMGQRVHVCSECGKILTRNEHLQRHIREVHIGERRNDRASPVPNPAASSSVLSDQNQGRSGDDVQHPFTNNPGNLQFMTANATPSPLNPQEPQNPGSSSSVLRHGVVGTPVFEARQYSVPPTHKNIPLSGNISPPYAASDTDTRVGEIQPGLHFAALDGIARCLSNEKRLHSLCKAAILRMDSSALIQHLAAFTVSLRKSMLKTDDRLKKDLTKVLRNSEFSIAMDICRYLGFPEEMGLMGRSHLGEPNSARKELLERYVREVSAGEAELEVDSLGTSVVNDNDDNHDGENGPIIEDEELDEELDEDPPTEENLRAIDKFSQVLFDSHYDEHLAELKNSIYPSAIETIEKVLLQHWLRDGQKPSITCIIDWQFLDYLVSQNIIFSQLEPTFIITGKPDCCGAATLGAYITSRWGRQLFDILRSYFERFRGAKDCSIANTPILENQSKSVVSHNVDGCDMQLFHQDRSKHFTKSIVVTLGGTLDAVSRILEQFAWLTSTLREGGATELMISEIQFEALHVRVGGDMHVTKESLKPHFRMTLRDQSTSLQVNFKDRGQCWAQFFSSSILTYGFRPPNLDRPVNAVGLEISFNIIAAFIGNVYPVMFGGRLAFANESIIIAPQTIMGNSIQWHVENIENIVRQVEGNKNLMISIDPTLEATDISSLMERRAFFGHCTFAEVLLGTKDFLRVESPNSEVPHAGREFKIKRDFTLSIGASAKGIATAQAASTIRYSPREVEQIEGNQLHIQPRIRRAKSSSILLYDQSTRIASLVSELSVALQMSIIYMRTNTKLEHTKFPFATSQADGGQAAYEAIMNSQDLDILPHIGGSQKLHDIVGGFLHIFEQRRTQSLLHELEYWTFGSSNELRGWDYADVQAMDYDFVERGLKVKKPPIWWELFKSHQTLVLFTRMDRQVIHASPAAHDSPRCQAWNEYPVNQDVLVTSVAQLLDLREKLCTSITTNQSRYMLNDKVYWARPTRTRLFDDSTCRTGGTCNPVQTMLKVGQHDIRYSAGPGPDLALHGAILFAQNPCEMLARPCKLTAPPQLPPLPSIMGNGLLLPSPSTTARDESAVELAGGDKNK